MYEQKFTYTAVTPLTHNHLPRKCRIRQKKNKNISGKEFGNKSDTPPFLRNHTRHSFLKAEKARLFCFFQMFFIYLQHTQIA